MPLLWALIFFSLIAFAIYLLVSQLTKQNDDPLKAYQIGGESSQPPPLPPLDLPDPSKDKKFYSMIDQPNPSSTTPSTTLPDLPDVAPLPTPSRDAQPSTFYSTPDDSAFQHYGTTLTQQVGFPGHPDLVNPSPKAPSPLSQRHLKSGNLYRISPANNPHIHLGDDLTIESYENIQISSLFYIHDPNESSSHLIKTNTKINLGPKDSPQLAYSNNTLVPSSSSKTKDGWLIFKDPNSDTKMPIDIYDSYYIGTAFTPRLFITQTADHEVTLTPQPQTKFKFQPA